MTRHTAASCTTVARAASFALLSVLSPVAAPSAFAHHPGGPGNSAGSGPINTISASTMAAGAVSAGIVVDYLNLDPLSDAQLAGAAEEMAAGGDHHAHVHSLRSITAGALTAAYGVSDDVTVSVRLPYVKRSDIREGHAHEHEPGEFEGAVHRLGDASGIGDVTVLGQWRFLRSAGLEFAALGGFKAPTGKTDETDAEGDRFAAEFQPGSGSWDGLLGLAATRRFGVWSFDASGLYTFVTEGTQDTDLGDRFHYGVAMSYRALGTTHVHDDGSVETHGPALDLVLELNGEWHDKQREGGEVDDNSGGHVLYVSPGVRLAQDKMSAFVSVGVPVVNDFNGIQAEADWRLVSGVSFGF